MDENEMREVKKIRLTVDSRLEEVFLVGLAVRGICAYTSLNEMEASQMEGCVVEVVNNAIKHSYHLQPGHDVDISISLYPERIEFSIGNTGEPMKSRQAARMDFDPKNVGALPEGGMGLYIVRSVMDEVTYQCLDGVNTVSMSKYFDRTCYPFD
jgi:serine/threonine-protein kinase RsbW